MKTSLGRFQHFSGQLLLTFNVTCFDFPLLPHPSNVVSKVNNLVRRGWPHHTCDLCHGRLTKMTMSTRVRVIIVALITDD